MKDDKYKLVLAKENAYLKEDIDPKKSYAIENLLREDEQFEVFFENKFTEGIFIVPIGVEVNGREGNEILKNNLFYYDMEEEITHEKYFEKESAPKEKFYLPSGYWTRIEIRLGPDKKAFEELRKAPKEMYKNEYLRFKFHAYTPAGVLEIWTVKFPIVVGRR